MSPTQSSPMVLAASSFNPRPFPPPALAHVPVEYIISQLHRLAVHYWDKPETADCTIVVPIVRPKGDSTRNARPTSPSLTSPSDPCSPAGLGTRVKPARATRITSKLHIDYLSAQSTLLRALFSGSPSTAHTTPSAKPSTQPRNHLPRLLPSTTPSHPIVYLPLPDPSSFAHLVHYMYFGQTTCIEDGLNRGTISWEGIVRNVEYLGLRTDLKVFLGRYYGNWIAHSGGKIIADTHDDSDESDSDFCPDSDSEDESDSESRRDSEAAESFNDPPRGRSMRRSYIFTRGLPHPGRSL